MTSLNAFRLEVPPDGQTHEHAGGCSLSAPEVNIGDASGSAI